MVCLRREALGRMAWLSQGCQPVGARSAWGTFRLQSCVSQGFSPHLIPPFKQGLGQPHWGVDAAWNSRAKEAGRSLPSISVMDKDTEARRGSGCVVRMRWGPRPTMMLLWLPGPHPE